MNSKILIRTLWTISIVTILITIGAYLLNFHSHSISKDPANWGVFGDYVGGILNPIIALLNLIVLVYLSIKLIDVEDKRNEFTLQELARPLGDITTIRQINGIDIIIKNCGLGPLKIKSIKILSDGKEYPTFKSLLPELPKDKILEWQYYHLTEDDHGILAKDDKESLVKIIGEKDDATVTQYFNSLHEILNKTKITIEYVDIYDRPMPSCSFDFTKLKLFGV